MHLLFILFLSFGSNLIHAKEEVPVVIWSKNEKSDTLNIPRISALKNHLNKRIISESKVEFGDSKNIMMFVQDNLSIEDFSSYPEEFGFLSSLMKETSNHLFFPKVEDPAHIELALKAQGYNVITLEPHTSVAGLTLKEDSTYLVIVKLPHTNTNPKRSEAILKSVEVMENVISKVGDKDFTFIYTGSEASVKTSLNKNHEITKRQIISDYDTSGNLTNVYMSNCSILYIRQSMSLFVTEYNQTTQHNLTDIPAQTLGDCQNVTEKLVLKYTGLSSTAKLWITLNFQMINGRQWNIYNAEVSTHEIPEENILLPYKEMMHVPIGYSFSCSQTITLKSNDTTQSGIPHYKLVIDGLQVEAFLKNNKSKFSDSWDCIGFFTIPIWMGLIVTFVLVFILGWGMNMLADLKTMDRFDDPKGQYILVPSNAE